MSDEHGDDDRRAILARRNRLIALALSGLTGATGCYQSHVREGEVVDAGVPVPCLSPPLEDSGTPVPCLGAPIEDAGPPRPCLDTPIDAGPGDAGAPVPCLGPPIDAGPPPEDAGGGGEPVPCLAILPPR
ncbi:MAG TPA: hypothetical protein VIL20_03300 [Sandaracinaceae bacterium]